MTGDSLALIPDGPLAARQASTDEQAIELWLHGLSRHTQRAYRRDIARFRSFVGKPLSQVTLGDVQGFVSALGELAPGSQSRALASVKSLLAFSRRIGYLPVNVGGAVRLPKLKNTMTERILDEADVHRLLSVELSPRDRALLRLLYAGGLRVSEVCALQWRDMQPRLNGEGQLTVYGKGGKTRRVLLPAAIWTDLLALRGAGSSMDAPLFRSKSGAHLDPKQVWRIVSAAAKRAGIAAHVSPHWLRHAHATHALEHGAPIHLVQQTLGHTSVATTGRYLHARPSESSSRFLEV